MAAARRIARIRAAVAAAGPRLRDLIGYGQVREAALTIIEDLAAWQQEILPWSDVCRGLLLCGPPGTGKTALARAMAREGGIGFVAASYADWQAQGHLGDFLAAMADSFATARRTAPAILFLDEIDAFQSRSAAGTRGRTNTSYDAKAIAGLLQHLDGIMGREGVVVVAACNHPEQLDPAIRRAGRFDRIITLAAPPPADLALILRQHLGPDLEDADLSRLARHALGRTGADCAAAVREARSTARRQRRAMVLADLETALLGSTGRISPAKAWRHAVHEAGHAIMHVATGSGRPVSLAIGDAGGTCLAEAPDITATPVALHHLRMTHLAGRAAERLICGAPSAGAGGPEDSDLALAMRHALAEEVSFGLGTFGPLWLGAEPEPDLFLRLPAPSQQAIRARLERAEAEATRILAANRALLLDLAGALARQHRLAGPELDALLARVRPLSGQNGTVDIDDTSDAGAEDRHNAGSPLVAASDADPAPQP